MPGGLVDPPGGLVDSPGGLVDRSRVLDSDRRPALALYARKGGCAWRRTKFELDTAVGVRGAHGKISHPRSSHRWAQRERTRVALNQTSACPLL